MCVPVFDGITLLNFTDAIIPKEGIFKEDNIVPASIIRLEVLS